MLASEAEEILSRRTVLSHIYNPPVAPKLTLSFRVSSFDFEPSPNAWHHMWHVVARRQLLSNRLWYHRSHEIGPAGKRLPTDTLQFTFKVIIQLVWTSACVTISTRNSSTKNATQSGRTEETVADGNLKAAVFQNCTISLAHFP